MNFMEELTLIALLISDKPRNILDIISCIFISKSNKINFIYLVYSVRRLLLIEIAFCTERAIERGISTLRPSFLSYRLGQ